MKTTEDIWIEYHNKLSIFLRTRVDSDVAEDILQDVFVKIHSRIDSLKDKTKLESWLYQITRNAVIDFYRSRRPTVNWPDWIEETQSNEDVIIRKELSLCLAPIIEQLPDKYRESIKLSEIEGKTQKEVAELENISLSGAKSRVQRGRALLKELMYKCCHFEFDRSGHVIDYTNKKGDCTSCSSVESD